MILKELAIEYSTSGQSCKTRADELEQILLNNPDMPNMEELRLRGRINTLRAMYRDTKALSKYLDTYYEGGKLLL